jgi:hypothetical protein
MFSKYQLLGIKSLPPAVKHMPVPGSFQLTKMSTEKPQKNSLAVFASKCCWKFKFTAAAMTTSTQSEIPDQFYIKIPFQSQLCSIQIAKRP